MAAKKSKNAARSKSVSQDAARIAALITLNTTRRTSVLMRITRALAAAVAAFMRSANRPSKSKIEITCDYDGRPFRAYVRGPRSIRKPSAETIEDALVKAQAKWDSANR